MTRHMMLWRHAFGDPQLRHDARRRSTTKLQVWQPVERIRWRDHLFE